MIPGRSPYQPWLGAREVRGADYIKDELLAHPYRREIHFETDFKIAKERGDGDPPR